MNSAADMPPLPRNVADLTPIKSDVAPSRQSAWLTWRRTAADPFPFQRLLATRPLTDALAAAFNLLTPTRPVRRRRRLRQYPLL